MNENNNGNGDDIIKTRIDNKIIEKEKEKEINVGNNNNNDINIDINNIVSINKDWKLLSNIEKNQIRLNSKKEIKKIQKEICDNIKCQICPTIKFTSIRMYRLHLTSKKHLKREKRSKILDTWSCKICQLNLPNESEWNKHSIGKKHLKSMKLYAEKNYPTSRPYFESDLKDIKQTREETEEDGEDLYPSFIG